VGTKVGRVFLDPIQCSGFLPFSEVGGGLPCQFKDARAADFNLSQWFTGIVFCRYFFYPFYAVFEDFVLLAYIPPVLPSILFQVFFFH